MTTLDPYEHWRESRRALAPPEDLPDRIMAAIHDAQAPRPASADSQPTIAQRAPRRRVALIAVAAAAFILRVAAAFAVFFTS